MNLRRIVGEIEADVWSGMKIGLGKFVLALSRKISSDSDLPLKMPTLTL